MIFLFSFKTGHPPFCTLPFTLTPYHKDIPTYSITHLLTHRLTLLSMYSSVILGALSRHGWRGVASSMTHTANYHVTEHLLRCTSSNLCHTSLSQIYFFQDVDVLIVTMKKLSNLLKKHARKVSFPLIIIDEVHKNLGTSETKGKKTKGSLQINQVFSLYLRASRVIGLSGNFVFLNSIPDFLQLRFSTIALTTLSKFMRRFRKL